MKQLLKALEDQISELGKIREEIREKYKKTNEVMVNFVYDMLIKSENAYCDHILSAIDSNVDCKKNCYAYCESQLRAGTEGCMMNRLIAYILEKPEEALDVESISAICNTLSDMIDGFVSYHNKLVDDPSFLPPALENKESLIKPIKSMSYIVTKAVIKPLSQEEEKIVDAILSSSRTLNFICNKCHNNVYVGDGYERVDVGRYVCMNCYEEISKLSRRKSIPEPITTRISKNDRGAKIEEKCHCRRCGEPTSPGEPQLCYGCYVETRKEEEKQTQSKGLVCSRCGKKVEELITGICWDCFNDHPDNPMKSSTCSKCGIIEGPLLEGMCLDCYREHMMGAL